ncbi:MAG: MarR family transcriptional regulator [Actinomycetota bacterium]|nr:MarR family transcriptional regulator [Actinomycetota bacterium]
MLAGSRSRVQSNSPTTGGLLHIRKEVIQLVEETLTLEAGWNEKPATDLSACRGAAEDAWRGLAAGISGRQRVRLSRDGGKTYPRRYERQITDKLPNQPAAVLIYDTTGCARTFCVDLDSSKGGRDAVERDFRSLSAILSRHGAHFFADRSPNGGIHVYVPLTEPLPFGEAAAAARALAAQTPTMDPMPMLGIDSGCIRPPGAWHKSGGHQELIDPLGAAYEAVLKRTSATVWERFAAEIGVGAPTPEELAAPPSQERPERLPALRRYDAPDATYQAIARTGQFDTSRYASPSEARQAVIWSAVAAGWDFVDVARRLADGTWPGLAAMYARYRPTSRHAALVREWRRAVAFEKDRRQITTVEPVRVGPTRALKTHGGGEYQQIRTWLNAVDLALAGNRDDLATRAVLAALAEAAQKTGAVIIEFGNRSLAVATGLDQRTVGKILNRLRENDEPLISLVQEAVGVKANAYELIVPAAVERAAVSKPWKKGKARGVRAAFRELGLPASFMYAALEQASEPLNGRDLAKDARLGVTTAYEALETLHSWGLAERIPGGWALGTAGLDALAEAFGIIDQIKAQIVRYREERRQYWAAIGIIRLTENNTSVGYYDDLPPPPPDEGMMTLCDILEDILGAHVIAETPNRMVG